MSATVEAVGEVGGVVSLSLFVVGVVTIGGGEIDACEELAPHSFRESHVPCGSQMVRVRVVVLQVERMVRVERVVMVVALRGSLVALLAEVQVDACRDGTVVDVACQRSLTFGRDAFGTVGPLVVEVKA